jgi:hypothetical protein
MPDIMQVLEELGEFGWAMRRPSAEKTAQALAYPPIISWRYKEPTATKAEVLARALAIFQGTIPWKFSTEHRNWVLMPARIAEYAQSHNLLGDLQAAEELRRNDPDFGVRANAELARLAEHIQRQLDQQKNANLGTG